MVAFIFADLIVIPILNIYRKHYGRRASLYLLVTFYAAMVVAGLVVETLFGLLGLIPDQRNTKVVETSITWDYTTLLNIAFLELTAALLVRFLMTGGPAILRMMDEAPAERIAHGPARPDERKAVPEREASGAYGCPMHPEVRSDTPGRCPKCGMRLEPL